MKKPGRSAVQGPAHGVIGFVHLQKSQFEDAEDEFDQAVKINPKDQMSWYRYGLAATKIAIAAQGLILPAYDEVNNNTDARVRNATPQLQNGMPSKRISTKTAIKRLRFSSPRSHCRILTSQRRQDALDSLWKATHNNTLRWTRRRDRKEKSRTQK